MELYLVQHGVAASKQLDPECPLTNVGIQETKKMATHMAKLGMGVSVIWHSTKVRAAQTAELFGAALKAPAIEVEGITPLDDPHLVKEKIDLTVDPTMIVGHLPHLTELIGLLVCENPSRELVKLRNSGVVCLSKEEAWAIKWILWPDLI